MYPIPVTTDTRDSADYDYEYFSRWYRCAKTRVRTPSELERQVNLVVGIAEFILDRRIRTVLDVGCGEGAWQARLKKLRPQLTYTGVDPSPYVLRRYGSRRNICYGRVETLTSHVSGKPYDLVVCSEVLNHLSCSSLRKGLRMISTVVGGVAFLELYTDKDDLVGDLAYVALSPAAYYRKLLKECGYTMLGFHCYTVARPSNSSGPSDATCSTSQSFDAV